MSLVCFVKANPFVATVAVATISFTSCSRGPTAIVGPSISPSGAGSKAMELYDKNGDGKVAGPELDQAPSLKAALITLDTNGDKAVDADEVAARVKAWQASAAKLTTFKARVTLDGQPLAGANVVFDPDPSLGDDIKAAAGQTNMYGDVTPTVPPEARPSPNWPPGVQYGLYIVRVTKNANGKESIPARFNTQSTLGQEISAEDPAFKNRNVKFDLKSGS